MSDPVTVVVVAYGRPDLLRACLSRLGGAFDVHVVDNSSSDRVAAVSVEFGARYTDPGANLGFGAAVNVALRELPVDGRDVVLLNPDAELDPSGIRAMVEALHGPGYADVAALAPNLVDGAGAPQRVMWPFPHPARAWLEAVGLGRLNRAQGFAVGAVLLLRGEALGQVGGFDERFFLYAEETDWQRRARRHGWRSAVLTTVTAVHVGGATSTDPSRREQLFHAAAETYVRTWFGVIGWQLYRTAIVAGAVVRALAPPADRRASAVRRGRLYLAGPRRCAGLER
jgi:GT2 family glycosyltransferase